MPVLFAEDALLNYALREGLISPADLAAVDSAGQVGPAPLRWGRRVDALIARGRLKEEEVQRIAALLASREISTGMEPTLDGPQAQPPALPANPSSEVEPDEAPSQAGKHPCAEVEPELARTLGSTSDGVAFPPSAIPAPFPVPNWDRYEFLSLLGRGGMGAVYKARDRRLGRIVALKFLHGQDPGQIQRFMQEARAQASLAHPSICQVFEVGTVENKPYIAMQLVDGLPLNLASRTMTLLEKVQVLKDAVQAIHAAHEQHIIHRDIKPSNIMVCRAAAPDGTVRHAPIIMDFGLARNSGAAKGLTESGAVMGTPAYMSPEQARGDVRRLSYWYRLRYWAHHNRAVAALAAALLYQQRLRRAQLFYGQGPPEPRDRAARPRRT